MKSLDKKTNKNFVLAIVFAVIIFLLCSYAEATIPGITGTVAGSETTFNLTAKSGYIVTPDGGSFLMWGYSDNDGIATMQYPGPTLIVDQGQTVIINLDNELTVNTSIVFLGQDNVTAAGGDADGIITREVAPNGTTVTYSFDAVQPGTYLYNSGTRMELQVEMGLVGAIIVRPTGFDPATNKIAYEHADSAYDVEYLFLITEMDPVIHNAIEFGLTGQVDNTTYWPVYWFINGRAAPDTMAPTDSPLFATQPYNCLPRMNPGQKMLLRMIGAGRVPHPFHTHGNNFLLIARDGRLLESNPGTSGPDLGISDFTQTVLPGSTYDAIFEWTGAGLGWDMYGHAPGDPTQPNEYLPDHGKPFPVVLPEQKATTFGAFYSGSPFLGAFDTLPPGQGGLNLNAGFFYMWHSHNEKEMVNNDIFPGGLMTMLIIEPPGVSIP